MRFGFAPSRGVPCPVAVHPSAARLVCFSHVKREGNKSCPARNGFKTIVCGRRPPALAARVCFLSWINTHGLTLAPSGSAYVTAGTRGDVFSKILHSHDRAHIHPHPKYVQNLHTHKPHTGNTCSLSLSLSLARALLSLCPQRHTVF